MSCADHNATCDRCYVPGHCCRALNLAGGSVANGKTMLEAIAVPPRIPATR